MNNKIIEMLTKFNSEEQRNMINVFFADKNTINTNYYKRQYEITNEEIKETLLNIKSQYISDKDISEPEIKIYSIIDELDINTESITIKYTNKANEYIRDIKYRYSKNELTKILQSKSKYTTEIYDMMKITKKEMESYFTIDGIKKYLKITDVKSYNRYPDFRRNVLEKAIDEINDIFDYKIEIFTRQELGKIKYIELAEKELEDHTTL